MYTIVSPWPSPVVLLPPRYTVTMVSSHQLGSCTSPNPHMPCMSHHRVYLDTSTLSCCSVCDLQLFFLTFKRSKVTKEPSLRWVGWEELVRGREGGNGRGTSEREVGLEGYVDFSTCTCVYMYSGMHTYCTRSGARFTRPHSFYP